MIFSLSMSRDWHYYCLWFEAVWQIGPTGVAWMSQILCPGSSHGCPIRSSAAGFPTPPPPLSGYPWEETRHRAPVGSICWNMVSAHLYTCQKQSSGTSGVEGSANKLAGLLLPRGSPNVFTILTCFGEPPSVPYIYWYGNNLLIYIFSCGITQSYLHVLSHGKHYYYLGIPALSRILGDINVTTVKHIEELLISIWQLSISNLF